MKLDLANFLQAVKKNPKGLIELARDGKGDAFAGSLKAGLAELNISVHEESEMVLVSLKRGRAMLPKTIEYSSFISHVKDLEHLYLNCTYGKYLVYATHSPIDLMEETLRLSQLFKIPFSEQRAFVRVADGVKIPVIEYKHPEPAVSVEIKRVRGAQYKRPMYELYIMNTALSAAIAAFLVGCHYKFTSNFDYRELPVLEAEA